MIIVGTVVSSRLVDGIGEVGIRTGSRTRMVVDALAGVPTSLFYIDRRYAAYLPPRGLRIRADVEGSMLLSWGEAKRDRSRTEQRH